MTNTPALTGEPSRDVPATGEEAAAGATLMRVLICGLLAGRKHRRIRVTYRQRERAFGVLLRLAYYPDGSVEAWLEEPQPDMRHGVTYVPASSKGNSDAD